MNSTEYADAVAKLMVREATMTNLATGQGRQVVLLGLQQFFPARQSFDIERLRQWFSIVVAKAYDDVRQSALNSTPPAKESS